MEETEEMSKAAVEINAMLEYVSQDIIDKIPKEFLDNLKEIESYDYFWEYDINKKVEEQDFSQKTLEIIGKIYKDYICDDVEKTEYTEELNNYILKEEEKKREKYNPDKIFEKSPNTTNQKQTIEVVDMVVTNSDSKVNFFKKLLNRIKDILKF